jgi:predicted aspartyl protease
MVGIILGLFLLILPPNIYSVPFMSPPRDGASIDFVVGHHHVEATIDTGATYVTMPHWLLDHLAKEGLAYNPKGKTMKFVDANGKTFESKYYYLHDMAIGDCHIEEEVIAVYTASNFTSIGMSLLMNIEPWLIDSRTNRFLYTCPDDL